eukprot:1004721-Pyramimonas_sp.AAC.1
MINKQEVVSAEAVGRISTRIAAEYATATTALRTTQGVGKWRGLDTITTVELTVETFLSHLIARESDSTAGEGTCCGGGGRHCREEAVGGAGGQGRC